MFIKKLHLQSFKRFSDLTIDLSSHSTTPRLVLLIGANGSGKSSIMDVFQTMSDYTTKGRAPNAEFIGKNGEYTINISTDQGDIIASSKNHNRNELAKKFYTRPSIRIVPEIGQGVKALDPVLQAMGDPLKSKTITLSTGKLTTGVSVSPRSGVLMLRNLKSPETYFQTAFRMQTPWVVDNPDGKSPNKKEILKKICYVFDFAPNRALSQIADYSNKLDPKEPNPEKKVADFINFLPVLAYDGSTMKEIDAVGILDIITSGTTATLLARRRESALLVNVDNDTLARLMANEQAMNVLMNIEGFRSLNQDLETIINKSESVKKTKQEANERDLTPKEKKELSDDEKEYKSKRKEIQQKLIKFATRIPVFMYLTDYRERSLKDVITQLEPELFRKVTGLLVQDFELLVSLNIFNDALMNDAVYKFKRYEDASLEYAGINKHEGQNVGGYNTVISRNEFDRKK